MLSRSRSTSVLFLLLSLAVAPLAAGCAGDTEDSPAAAGEEDEIVRAIKLDELAAGSALRAKVEEQNTNWLDENIMNGSASVIVRKVAPASIGRLDRIARAAFNERIKNEEVTLRGAVTAKPGGGDIVPEAGKRIALDGFVYSDNRENISPVEKAVKQLVTALGPAADIETMIVEGKVIVPSADDDNKTWRAATFVFANKKTAEIVIFYAREGWI
jgi:hypothetical protein